MTIKFRNIPVRFLIRRSVRYLLIAQGFRLIQAIFILAALSFVLTGSRIAAIDRYGNRADIVASIVVTIATIAILTALNRRVMNTIDRRFFREAYDAQLILTDLGEAIPALSRNDELVELVANQISDALHPGNVTIFLNGPEAAGYVSAFSFEASTRDARTPAPERGLILPADDFVNRLGNSNRSSSIDITDVELASLGSNVGSEMVLSEPARRTLRAVHSTLLIPIASNGTLYGLISLGQRLSDLPYAEEDKRLLQVVANQMATFIEIRKAISRMAEEERIARELEMAAEVQRHLFPADGLEDDALQIYGVCLPARGVGGDYYDYFELENGRTGIAIADVAGKGIAAALLMSTVQASLRCQITSGDRSLSEVVSTMNRLLRRSTSDGGYATFFFAEFDKTTGGLTYVNAGHNPPLLVRIGRERPGAGRDRSMTPRLPRVLASKSETNAGVALGVEEEPTVTPLTTGGPIIGTFLDEPYEQETIYLQSGDNLVVYTDGVTEAMNPAGLEFGEERLRAIIAGSLALPAREAAVATIAKVLEWQGLAPQHDDITLIVVKVK